MKPHPFAGRMATSLLIATLAPSLAAAETVTVKNVFSDYQQLLDSYLEEKWTADGGLVSAFDYEAALADEPTKALLEDQAQRLAGLMCRRWIPGKRSWRSGTMPTTTSCSTRSSLSLMMANWLILSGITGAV